jgi:hypothetical protein
MLFCSAATATPTSQNLLQGEYPNPYLGAAEQRVASLTSLRYPRWHTAAPSGVGLKESRSV